MNFTQPNTQLNFVLYAHLIPAVDTHPDTVDVLNKIGEKFDTPIRSITSPVGKVESEIILNEASHHLCNHINHLENEMEVLQYEDVNNPVITEKIRVIKQLESFNSAITEKLKEIKIA